MTSMDARRFVPDPETLATKVDLNVGLSSVEERLTMRMDSLESRLEGRMDALEARMDARFARMESTLTQRMITIMGAWTILVGSTMGWVSALLR
jgi:hypothetical protein